MGLFSNQSEKIEALKADYENRLNAYGGLAQAIAQGDLSTEKSTQSNDLLASSLGEISDSLLQVDADLKKIEADLAAGIFDADNYGSKQSGIFKSITDTMTRIV